MGVDESADVERWRGWRGGRRRRRRLTAAAAEADHESAPVERRCASARTKVTTCGARASAVERQSPPPLALELQVFAVISMMIRFAPQQPQALVLSSQTDVGSRVTCVAIGRPL